MGEGNVGEGEGDGKRVGEANVELEEGEGEGDACGRVREQPIERIISSKTATKHKMAFITSIIRKSIGVYYVYLIRN